MVEELFLAQVRKPLQVEIALRNKGLTGHDNRQLRNFMAQLRKKHLGSSSTTTCDIEGWCMEHSQEPDGEHDAFVHAFSVNHESKSFRVVMTTKHLLKAAGKAKVLQIDATYKVNWNGYPVIVAGVADANKSFFPCMICVVSTETKEDYAFVMQSMKDGARLYHDLDFNPEVVVADMAKSISAAVSEVFPDAVRRTCWFHLKKAVEQRARKETGGMCEVVLKDISDLQLSPSPDQFYHAATLMMEKWEAGWPGSPFTAYFRDVVLSENCTFYEGAHEGSPSTNNGLEAVNCVIKDIFTVRNRLPLGQFLRQMVDISRHWSMDLGTRRKMSEKPVAAHAELKKAYE